MVGKITTERRNSKADATDLTLYFFNSHVDRGRLYADRVYMEFSPVVADAPIHSYNRGKKLGNRPIYISFVCTVTDEGNPCKSVCLCSSISSARQYSNSPRCNFSDK